MLREKNNTARQNSFHEVFATLNLPYTYFEQFISGKLSKIIHIKIVDKKFAIKNSVLGLDLTFACLSSISSRLLF